MYKARDLRRYHRRVWLPNNAKSMILEFKKQLPFVDLTAHAAKEMARDKGGMIPLPTKEELFDRDNELVEIFEILRNGKPLGIAQKLVLRAKKLNNLYDYAYVIAREGYIVTSWATHKNDNHRLTKSLYEYYVPENLKDEIYKKILNE
ncbi:MAG: hypothetical protein CO117_02080 [Flavobacteriaceae bacterium CG_4_9_14_3_um_filter_33_16]|nr:MAG: hypothetical protein CO117_02080 [Flavobacteriaceae bacterium CG_4_9_14_3_um_filter_33_16]